MTHRKPFPLYVPTANTQCNGRLAWNNKHTLFSGFRKYNFSQSNVVVIEQNLTFSFGLLISKTEDSYTEKLMRNNPAKTVSPQLS